MNKKILLVSELLLFLCASHVMADAALHEDGKVQVRYVPSNGYAVLLGQYSVRYGINSTGYIRIEGGDIGQPIHFNFKDSDTGETSGCIVSPDSSNYSTAEMIRDHFTNGSEVFAGSWSDSTECDLLSYSWSTEYMY